MPRPGGESRRRYENPLSLTAREGSSPSARTTPSPCSLGRETAGHHAPAPAAQGWNDPSPHAIDGRYMPAHPHFLSAPQGARIKFFFARLSYAVPGGYQANRHKTPVG